ncbi:transport permease protein [Clostridium butyricum]|uniref:Transport permease protein n=1 Tax=Clostridium butyricum TaxID=1492 RepID=A0A512TNN3_CLOBU|nr:ABC transporter permease [Clostridium butyricum]NOW22721.1 ABC-2 type transport system permease protein [Clostridium butyricum]GEQ21743.1 transport permease protein [Clostridium butyricum]
MQIKRRRLLTIAKKEFIQIKRDKASLIIAVMMPIMMLLLFGFAVNTDVNNVNLVVYDGSKTMESRELVNKFTNSYYFKLYDEVDSTEEVENYINSGKVKVGLVIPSDYTKNLKRNTNSEVQILVDGSDPTIARTAMSYSVLIGNNYSNSLKLIEKSKAGLENQQSLGVNVKPLVLYNPSLESSTFNIPGVIGLILQNITVILTSFAMVREKEKGTMEQLIMTPVTSFELIIGKLIPYIIIGFLDMLLSLALGYIIFGVGVKGSLLLLILLGTLFLICSLAIGMLISTISKTQLQAMQAAVATILPSVILSGFMFPREAMEKVIYYISNIIPITYFLEILRDIMIKGSPLKYLISPIISLLTITIIIIIFSMKNFRKTLD